MISEETILKDAIAYLTDSFEGYGVTVLPKNQRKPSSFPCITVTVSSSPSVIGIWDELLASVTIHCTIYADNVYAPSAQSTNGIHTLFDRLNEVMSDKHFHRSNQTEPYYNQIVKKWNKDGSFTKRTNTF